MVFCTADNSEFRVQLLGGIAHGRLDAENYYYYY